MLTDAKDAGRALCTSTAAALQKITNKMLSKIDLEFDKIDGAALNLVVQKRELALRSNFQEALMDKCNFFFFRVKCAIFRDFKGETVKSSHLRPKPGYLVHLLPLH